MRCGPRKASLLPASVLRLVEVGSHIGELALDDPNDVGALLGMLSARA
jgi:hypothetical protein